MLVFHIYLHVSCEGCALKICIIYRGGTHSLHGWTYILSCTLTFIAI